MRKAVVILEGPDGSGKTTLAEALGRVGYEYDHCGAPEKLAVDYYKDALRRHGGPVVIDRWHAGSYVYGTAFRGMDDLSPDERWTLEGTAMAQGGVMVYTIPPAEVIDKNLERGPDNAEAAIYEVPEKRAMVRNLYQRFMGGMTQMPLIQYDYTVMLALESTVKAVRDWHLRFDQDAMLPAHIPALGNIVDPKYVFVGDEPSGRPKVLRSAKKLYPNDPARRARFAELAFSMADYYDRVPFQDCTSGRYLQIALSTAGLKLSDYCVFNSRQLDGEDVASFMPYDSFESTAVGWKDAQVVALGNEASKRLAAAGFPHRTVPHPSFWKRFHYRDFRTYAKALKGEA